MPAIGLGQRLTFYANAFLCRHKVTIYTCRYSIYREYSMGVSRSCNVLAFLACQQFLVICRLIAYLWIQLVLVSRIELASNRICNTTDKEKSSFYYAIAFILPSFIHLIIHNKITCVLADNRKAPAICPKLAPNAIIVRCQGIINSSRPVFITLRMDVLKNLISPRLRLSI